MLNITTLVHPVWTEVHQQHLTKEKQHTSLDSSDKHNMSSTHTGCLTHA
jgi:hypothetical protein